VWSWGFDNEEAMAHLGFFLHGEKINPLIDNGNKENYRQCWNIDNQGNHGEVSKQSSLKIT